MFDATFAGRRSTSSAANWLDLIDAEVNGICEFLSAVRAQSGKVFTDVISKYHRYGTSGHVGCVAWHSGRTLVFDRRTFSVLR